MIVDQELLERATRLLGEQFPDRPGQACAMYSVEGKIYTGVSSAGPPAVEAETTPIFEVAKNRDMIAASVTVSWDGPGSSVRCRTPPAPVLHGLHHAARREAQIAIDGPANAGEVATRALRELIRDPPNTAFLSGNFGGGMKAITHELNALAKERGLPAARAEFQRYLSAALNDALVLKTAQHRTRAEPDTFFMPTSLGSVSLRHIWLALDLASVRFTNDLVAELTPELTAIGCNEFDLVHIKQAIHAFRYTAANAIVLVETRAVIKDEIPFNPTMGLALVHGVPMHAYIRLDPPAPAKDVAEKNLGLVQQLVQVLANKQEGGLFAYARQRGLFTLDVFDGGGPGRCPFWQVSGEMFQETAAALERALHQGAILLAPDQA